VEYKLGAITLPKEAEVGKYAIDRCKQTRSLQNVIKDKRQKRVRKEDMH
jgi:hypothetical protein